MSNKDKGFVLLWRSIGDNPMFDDGSPFDKFHAWCDLLCMVNYKDKKAIVNGKPVIIHRGQILTSIVKLANRWNWSRNRVARTLNMFEADSMIETKRSSNGTTITVINYGFYNDMRSPHEAPNEAADEAPNEAAGGAQLNNDINNDKNNGEIKRPAPLINAWGEVVEE